MWYFMAGMESSTEYVSKNKCLFGLMTFYGLYAKSEEKIQEKFERTLPYIDKILVDSGAYSFRHGASTDFDSFLESYIRFIKNNTNNEKIVGFFELDIDTIVGYDKVLEYRKKLEEVSDKIIPVWHQNRGISEFHKMCKQYSGRRVAVACVGWRDMFPHQLNLFINTAHKYNCKIHVLGMTSADIIKNSNLGLEDSFDSVGWLMAGAYANIALHIKEDKKITYDMLGRLQGLASTRLHSLNYICFQKIQEYYKDKDQSVSIL